MALKLKNMIHVIAGKRNSEFEKALQAALRGFGDDVERVTITHENAANLFDQIRTPSLFGERKTFIISGLFDDDDVKKEFVTLGDELAKAPHDVMVTLESILAADLKKFESFAKVEKVAEKKAASSFGSQGAFNPFSLANAFATGDKKKTWIAYQEVLLHDSEIEPLHGMIWWKLKDMIQKGAPLSPDTKSLARKLVAVYHESRMGGLDMKERLEEFFLTMPSKK